MKQPTIKPSKPTIKPTKKPVISQNNVLVVESLGTKICKIPKL